MVSCLGWPRLADVQTLVPSAGIDFPWRYHSTCFRFVATSNNKKERMVRDDTQI